MKSLARGTFLLTLMSCIILFLAWIIPCWFGRVHRNPQASTKTLWGLFYRVECTSVECASISSSLKNHNVDFRGAVPPLRVEAIVVLATLSFILSLCGMILVVIFHYHACGRHQDYKNLVATAALIQVTEAILVFLTIVLSAVANGVFFSKSSMKDANEFPWSLLLFCIAEVMLITSAIILCLIMCRWKKYRYMYNKPLVTSHTTCTAIEPYKRYEEAVPEYRIESYDHYRPYDNYRPYNDYHYGGYNDHIIPVNSGYYDKAGVPYKSMFGRTRYYVTHPYRNDYMDYSYIPERQVVPYYTPRNNLTTAGMGYDYMPVPSGLWHTPAYAGVRSGYWNSGMYDYMPVSSGLRYSSGIYDNAVVRRTEPMLINEPLLYTNDYLNTHRQLYYP